MALNPLGARCTADYIGRDEWKKLPPPCSNEDRRHRHARFDQTIMKSRVMVQHQHSAASTANRRRRLSRHRRPGGIALAKATAVLSDTRKAC